MDLVFIKNIEDYMAYKQLKPVNNYKYKKVQFICSICGEIKVKTFKSLTTDFICSNCTISKSVNNPEIREKKRNTCNKKYGVDHYNKTQESKIKHKETSLAKYGVEHYTKTDEFKANYINTCHEKYGVDNVFQLNSVKEKAKMTCNEKYGAEFYSQTDEYKDRYINTCQEKYGVDNVSQLQQVLLKKKQTCLSHYGVEFPIQCSEIRKNAQSKYTYDGINFDSMPELAYYIWLIDNNINFTYKPDIKFEYIFEDKKHYYQPDFIVNDEITEIKGLQFFENKDKTKSLINPYDPSQNGLYNAKYQCMIKNNVKILTDDDYLTYINYVNNKYTSDFLALFKNNIEFPYLNQDLHDISDYGIIQHFHKSIYEANRNNKPSPISAWEDKNLIKTIAFNRLKYVGSCKPSDILQGFNVTKRAPKVSVFKPKLAEYLINTFLADADIIIDPFSGFSGRLLGAVNCNKHYIGFDINEKHIKETNDIINYKVISDMCKVSVQNILTVNSINWDYLKDICLFTCPPYNDKEHWNPDDINKSCDEWIDICLEKHKGCKKYLFVVDKTEKYKNNIVFTIENKSHFNKNKEYVILI